jgi:hypothetical protein
VKRKSVYIVAFIVISIHLLAFFYFNNHYQKIDIFTAKGFDKETNTPISSITDHGTLRLISTIIKTSPRIEGILDVAQPPYVLEVHTFTDGIKTIFLWLHKDSIEGMFMYKNNTDIGYTISKENTLKLKQIILFAKN